VSKTERQKALKMKSNILINIQKLLFPAVLLLFTDLASFSQAVTVKADTTKVSQGISQSTEKINDKALNGNSGNQQANNRNNSGGNKIKQVRSARPDMSKARGARPPSIERPSGSRIPKGVGRPGGAIKPGKK
jgi:hypothetical protein